jgi:phosphate transport system permease protein
MIFAYAISPYDDWHRQAWAAGFILLMFILAINVTARFILSRSSYSPRGA